MSAIASCSSTQPLICPPSFGYRREHCVFYNRSARSPHYIRGRIEPAGPHVSSTKPSPISGSTTVSTYGRALAQVPQDMTSSLYCCRHQHPLSGHITLLPVEHRILSCLVSYYIANSRISTKPYHHHSFIPSRRPPERAPHHQISQFPTSAIEFRALLALLDLSFLNMGRV